MFNTSLCALFVVLLAACTSGTPVQEPPAAPPADPPKPAAPPAEPPPDRSCKQLRMDAHAFVSAHNSCTADTDCAMAAPACPEGLACGAVVNGASVERTNAELGLISDRFKAQCGECAREHVRCGKPNLVCREGRCKHEAKESECERLEAEARALIQEHNTCAADGDCVFAREAGACPLAFACGVTINKAEEQAFVAVAAPLSKTFYEYCDRCRVKEVECSISTPICEAGRCSRKRVTRFEPPSQEQQCEQLEHAAQTLQLAHNRCQTTADCVIATGLHCPEAFACGVALHKAEEQDFRERVVAIASTYRDQCKCADAPGDCTALAPLCADGRCRLEPAVHRHPATTP